jgi:hypothetical protein
VGLSSPYPNCNLRAGLSPGARTPSTRSRSSQFVLAYSPSSLETDSAVLFLDGSVSRIPPQELEAKLADQGTAAATP